MYKGQLAFSYRGEQQKQQTKKKDFWIAFILCCCTQLGGASVETAPY